MASKFQTRLEVAREPSIITLLAGLPHIVVDFGNGLSTSSIQEAHRLNSPYIINDFHPAR